MGWNILVKKGKVPKVYFYANCFMTVFIPIAYMRRGNESSIWKLSRKLQAIHDWANHTLVSMIKIKCPVRKYFNFLSNNVRTQGQNNTFECSQILIIKEIYFWFEIKRARTMIKNVLISIFYILREMLGLEIWMKKKIQREITVCWVDFKYNCKIIQTRPS